MLLAINMIKIPFRDLSSEMILLINFCVKG